MTVKNKEIEDRDIVVTVSDLQAWNLGSLIYKQACFKTRLSPSVLMFPPPHPTFLEVVKGTLLDQLHFPRYFNTPPSCLFHLFLPLQQNPYRTLVSKPRSQLVSRSYYITAIELDRVSRPNFDLTSTTSALLDQSQS